MPAIVRSNKSVVLIKIMANDAIYSFSESSSPSFWVLSKQICLSNRGHNHIGHGRLVFHGPGSIGFSAKSSQGITDNIVNKVEEAIHWASLLFIDVCLVDWHCILYILDFVLFTAQHNGILVFVE